MRLVIFTDGSEPAGAVWWRVLLGTRGLRAVLVCRRGGAPLPLPGPGPHVAASVEQLSAGGPPDVVRSHIVAWRPDVAVCADEWEPPATLTAVARLGVLLARHLVGDRRCVARPGAAALAAGALAMRAAVEWRGAGRAAPRVLARAEAPLYPHDTCDDCERRARELAAVLLRQAVERLRDGDVGAGVDGDTGDATPDWHGEALRGPGVAGRALLTLRDARRRWARSLGAPRMLAKTLLVGAALAVVRPLRDAARTLLRRHPVRVFTFHRVSDLCRDPITVPPTVFRAQLDFVRRHHVVLGLDECVALLARGARLRRPVAAITFDDAYRSVADHAVPALAERGLTGCCFVATGVVGPGVRFEHDRENPMLPLLDVMGWETLHALREAGWQIGAHTVTHARLSACDDAALERELAEPPATLQERLGVEQPVIAYPFGAPDDIDARARRRIGALGYVACFSNHGGENRPPIDLLTARRIDLGADLPGHVWRARALGVDPGALRDRLVGRAANGATDAG